MWFSEIKFQKGSDFFYKIITGEARDVIFQNNKYLLRTIWTEWENITKKGDSEAQRYNIIYIISKKYEIYFPIVISHFNSIINFKNFSRGKEHN